MTWRSCSRLARIQSLTCGVRLLPFHPRELLSLVLGPDPLLPQESAEEPALVLTSQVLTVRPDRNFHTELTFPV